MKLIDDYTPPAPEDLNRLKDYLGYTGTQMADLAGVASNSQWRKYTGGENPRAMSPHILFFIAAQLALSEDELQRVIKKMHEIGASSK
ncbi:helix-turn-helix transcriptional regulator [Salmonella enterica]|nr:helix-turn-helix transcriptional regulator [Salmonella enterica]